MARASSTGSTRSGRRRQLLGRREPRLFTEPARRLTRKSTLGYEAAEFASEVLGVELLPWQRWWLLHALEVDEQGDFRFRVVLTLVARQNGKTTLLKILALWAMYTGRARLVLGAAQSLDIARESWQGAVDIAQEDPELDAEVESVRLVNGQQEFRLHNGARYRIAATTRKAGRGLSVDLLILDELREHRSWEAWGALSKTTQARPNALIVPLSNAGDDESVVLNQLREVALAGSDPSIALFEWSAPDGCELDDRAAWAQANPALGHRNGISEQAVASSMSTDPPATFRTEVLCQRVDALDSAVDLGAWRAAQDAQSSLEAFRDQVVLCVDVGFEGPAETAVGTHVTVVAAAVDGARAVVDVQAAWATTAQARDELPALIEKIRPRAVAWYPSGPAAELAPVLRPAEPKPITDGVRQPRKLIVRRRGPEYVEIKGGMVTEACMGFAGMVKARQVTHSGDPLLSAHLAGAMRLPQGDGWRFARRGAGHVDAAYAAAGAVYAALTVPIEKARPRPMVV